MGTSKKKKYIIRNWLGLYGYLALSNRKMFKTNISDSPMASSSARNFITFVNYLKAMINKFTILISIYLYGVLNERQR